MDILSKIVARVGERLEAKKEQVAPERIEEMARRFVQAEAAEGQNAFDPANPGGFRFEKALKRGGMAFICEVKKASPSKGVIAADFPYTTIAKAYEQAGAAAVSVLTEEYYFQGNGEYLIKIAKAVSIPVLRKDFIIDRYMIYEAKIWGASAVLLICALLNPETLAEYIALTHSLGMSALVEAHDEAELRMALAAGARIVGVNNRDLRTFSVDIYNSIRLRKLAPPDVAFVSESGIRLRADVELLRENGVDAVLIGETLMRAPDKNAALAELRGV